MRVKNIHRWRVPPKEAIKIQKRLSGLISLKPIDKNKIKRVAGVDVSFAKGKSFAAVVVMDFPELAVIEEVTACTGTDFPYIPGLLTFREAPAVLNCLKKLKNAPDVFIFDGQGIAHPRSMGLASHLGLVLKKPSIGCAKSYLYGIYTEPGVKKGNYSFVKDRSGRVIGTVLRTRDGVRPVFVSPGYLADVKGSTELALAMCRKYRIPEPLRRAHHLSRMRMREACE